jgi:hypothetical protein
MDDDNADADSEEEPETLELDVPAEPTALRGDLQTKYADKLNPMDPNSRNPQAENKMEVPADVAEEATSELEAYLWGEWGEELAGSVEREDFRTIANLPQSNAVRWLKEEVSWDYYVESIVQKLERRDELLEELT